MIVSRAGFSWPCECEGIYAVTDAREDVKYIGQTGNVQERLQGHERAACWKSLGGDRYFFRPMRGVEETERRRVEGTLIQKYDPPCNRQGTTSEK